MKQKTELKFKMTHSYESAERKYRVQFVLHCFICFIFTFTLSLFHWIPFFFNDALCKAFMQGLLLYLFPVPVSFSFFSPPL